MTPDDPRHQHPDRHRADPAMSRDELASALLDGVLSGDEAAEARRRPDVVARAAEMDAARAALRDLPAVDAGARDQAVAAALAAFDADAGSGEPRPGSSVTSDLGARRRATGGGARRWLGAAAAVAAVVVGAAGLAVLSSNDGGDQDVAVESSDQSSGQASTDDSTSDEEDGAASAPSAESGGSALDATTGEAGDLGTFPSSDALADHVESLVSDTVGADEDAGGAEPSPTAPVAPSAEQRAVSDDAIARLGAACASGLPAPLGDTSALRLHGTAVVDGDPVDVWVLDGGDGTRTLAIDERCTVVVDRPTG